MVKSFFETNALLGLVIEGSHLEKSTSYLSHVDYNVLVHLRKVSTKMSIYHFLILSNKLRDSLVKVLLDPKIYIVVLDNPN